MDYHKNVTRSRKQFIAEAFCFAERLWPVFCTAHNKSLKELIYRENELCYNYKTVALYDNCVTEGLLFFRMRKTQII